MDFIFHWDVNYTLPLPDSRIKPVTLQHRWQLKVIPRQRRNPHPEIGTSLMWLLTPPPMQGVSKYDKLLSWSVDSPHALCRIEIYIKQLPATFFSLFKKPSKNPPVWFHFFKIYRIYVLYKPLQLVLNRQKKNRRKIHQLVKSRSWEWRVTMRSKNQ